MQHIKKNISNILQFQIITDIFKQTFRKRIFFFGFGHCFMNAASYVKIFMIWGEKANKSAEPGLSIDILVK